VTIRAAAAVVVAAGCASPAARTGGRPPLTLAAPSPLVTVTLLDLVGTWQWQLQTTEAATTRVERESWRLQPIPGDSEHLAGRYVRDVDVTSTDRAPFGCDQQPRYRQRALFDVVVTADADASAFTVHETAVQTEPSPCDHGFRHLGDYRAELSGRRMVLAFDDGGRPGTETLHQIDDLVAALPEPPWPARYDLAGAWRWQSTVVDTDGNYRDETEWWEITARGDAAIDATYRRRVTVRSADGSPLACANAPSWSFDDAYVLAGEREEEHWHFHELAVDPGDHPCLRATPRRDLDEGTAEQIGDYVAIEWRGKRRQVLFRPDREPNREPGTGNRE
jgi:hypothetical protein